jgi:hypothetical protein
MRPGHGIAGPIVAVAAAATMVAAPAAIPAAASAAPGSADSAAAAPASHTSASLASPVSPASAASAAAGALTPAQRATLLGYGRAAWHALTAMVDEQTGLPDDNIGGALDPASRGGYTSPTNVGAYLWSTVVARDTGIIGAGEAYRRMAATLRTMSGAGRHAASGMFYNWYAPATGAVLHTWPPDGSALTPFLSSVDNGWFAAALMVVQNAEPRLRAAARTLLAPMDFGFFYDAQGRGPDVPAGLLRGGFWDTEPAGCSVKDNYRGRGPDVWYTCNRYDILNTEPRIASYIGIARGQLPRAHYFAPNRTFPPTCDWGWLEQQPVGFQTSYLGVPVFEGAYRYEGLQFVPTWGGDMFEALMPDLFVPEEDWGPRSWGVNHPAYVRGQIIHGLADAKYGYWGFSPASNPTGGYSAWGVEAMGMDPAGYPSAVDPGFGDCRAAQPPPASYGDGVVTPHAAFLALPFAPAEAVRDLARLRADFPGLYGAGGFKDAVAVRSGRVADRYLSLDQGMIMGALGNVLRAGAIRRYFVRGDVERVIRPLLGLETFNARPPA